VVPARSIANDAPGSATRVTGRHTWQRHAQDNGISGLDVTSREDHCVTTAVFLRAAGNVLKCWSLCGGKLRTAEDQSQRKHEIFH